MESKRTTTVAMDFGRISIGDDIVLYLFGTPGQDRFWFLWDELALGALGAVVLADTRRLADCFPSIDYFERQRTPFLVAVNCFDGAQQFEKEAMRRALDLDPDVPIVMCDARSRESAKDVLISLVEHVLTEAAQPGHRAARGGRIDGGRDGQRRRLRQLRASEPISSDPGGAPPPEPLVVQMSLSGSRVPVVAGQRLDAERVLDRRPEAVVAVAHR